MRTGSSRAALTVNYALGTTKPFLSAAELKTASPYNTYLHPGLPPTPIDSPGQAALVAALNPAQGDFLYFVTTDPTTGDTTFTASLKEATALREKVAELNGDITANTPDFCVSPDGRIMLYSRLEIAVSQVRMIEGL